MHITTKDTDKNGVHILTSIIEADGAAALASEKAEFDAKVISVQRTASGGIQVQTAVEVKEPTPAPAAAPEAAAQQTQASPAEQATAYLVSKGLSEEEAAAKVTYLGADRILAAAEKEKDEHLEELLYRADLAQRKSAEPSDPAAQQ